MTWGNSALVPLEASEASEGLGLAEGVCYPDGDAEVGVGPAPLFV